MAQYPVSSHCDCNIMVYGVQLVNKSDLHHERRLIMYFVKYPYLQTPTAEGVTVMWETDENAISELHVWEAYCPSCGDVKYSPIGEPAIFRGEKALIHRIKVTGLKEGKDYCCRTLSKGNAKQLESDLCVFRTQPKINAPISFAVTSETGGSQSSMQIMGEIVDAISSERPDFLLFLGDMVYDGNRKQDWDEYLFTPFRKLLDNTPFYHCAGNHEDHSDYMRQYLATPEEGYYAFTYGCAQFIALDTTTLSEHIEYEKDNYKIELTGDLTPRNPQVAFLIKSLKESTAAWKFVYMHYPPYFSGTWEAECLRPLYAIFEEYGVDIVFTSHAIVYERSHPITNGSIDYANGVRYIVVGGAGAFPQWFHHKKAWHTAKSRAVPHFAHISLTEEHLEFQAIDYEGRLFDTFTLEQKKK